ncbi:alpha-1,2-fucosyltransferase [Candidatus Pelagibacter sp.]|nr:alpha-1,2-fucosyltransferase [Candidatus Pelagibacter sp.]
MTIKVKLSGGLGNQMFQFATGFAVAKKNNVKLILDLKYINRRHLFNGFELDNVFNIYSKVSFLNKGFSFKSFNFKDVFNKLNLNFYNFEEPHFHYTSKILDIPKHSFLDGYWQSELYFKDYFKEIKEIFTFSDPPDKQNNLIINDINQTNSVSIHIRRGDFLLKKNNNHLTDLKDYYLKAINETSKIFKNPKYFIFTDDPLWVAENFDLNHSYINVNINHGNKSFLDMYLMSLCKSNIIANSSFSWWSAWLNNKTDKIIYAPKNWFNDQSISTIDLIPKTWRII